MKKIISLAMCLILLLSLCACGKSKQAKAVEEQISAIGDVSLENEATVLSALENYNQLTDDEKKTVENYSVLESALNTIDTLNQEKIETELETIDTLIFKQLELEQAEASCLKLLENEKLSDEQAQRANDYLDDIARICFAGTYIVLPDYITGREAESMDGTTVKNVLNGKQAYAEINYKTKGEVSVAADYYLSYLNEHFWQVSSEVLSSWATRYLFCDADRREFAVNTVMGDRYGQMLFEFANGLFDYDKLDSSNPDAEIWDTNNAVLRK